MLYDVLVDRNRSTMIHLTYVNLTHNSTSLRVPPCLFQHQWYIRVLNVGSSVLPCLLYQIECKFLDTIALDM